MTKPIQIAPGHAIDDQEHQDELQAALEAMGPLDEAQRAYVTSTTLIRYLRARQGHIHAAAKLLHATLVWRKEMKLDTLCVDEFKGEMASGRMYVAGRDSEGHSVLITRKKNDSPYKPGPGAFEHYMRHLAFTAETCVRAMQQGQHQWVWILDMAAFKRDNSPPLSVTIATVRMLANHYPERLKLAVFVDAPGIFAWVWGALTPLLDHVTRSKVHFVKSADLPPAALQGGSPGHDQPVGSKAPHPLSPSVTAFLPYVEFWKRPYDEAGFRHLLGEVGWPGAVEPLPAEVPAATQ